MGQTGTYENTKREVKGFWGSKSDYRALHIWVANQKGKATYTKNRCRVCCNMRQRKYYMEARDLLREA